MADILDLIKEAKRRWTAIIDDPEFRERDIPPHNLTNAELGTLLAEWALSQEGAHHG